MGIDEQREHLRDYGFGRGTFSRRELVIMVWTAQLLASKPLLDRFGHGPLEWIVRSITYRRLRLKSS